MTHLFFMVKRFSWFNVWVQLVSLFYFFWDSILFTVVKYLTARSSDMPLRLVTRSSIVSIPTTLSLPSTTTILLIL